MTTIDGHDPLFEHLDSETVHIALIQDSTRRVVQNILKSYTGYFDVFNESLQNALDAVEAKWRQGLTGYQPRIYVTIDIPRRILRVVDNGVGMDVEQFKLCFRPNTSFKNKKESRGNKGVGATFLAYGFSRISLQTKVSGASLAANLRGGKDWAEERTNERPKLEEIEFDTPELEHEVSGTAIEILIGEGQRPKLAWLAANTASTWHDVLRIKTPLGGVYVTKNEKENLVQPEVTIKVISTDGSETQETTSQVEYYYPHDMPIFDTSKIKTVGDIEAMEKSISGNLKSKAEKIPDSFRRLEAIWEIWDHNEIISHKIFSRELTEDQKTLLIQHAVTVYGFFISTARRWADFQSEVLKVHAGARLLEGGLQMASDHMVQGDLMVIPLSSAAGYHRHAHVLVHFHDGNPDMGRKVFQPELKELAEEIAKRAVDVFRSNLDYLRGDSGAPPQKQVAKHFEWLMEQRRRRDDSPLTLEIDGERLPFVAVPLQEQEVIGVFNQLLGSGAIRGLQVISLSELTQYDCSLMFHYPDESYRYNWDSNPLGVRSDSIGVDASKPQTLEFKYNLDGLTSDFENNVKYPADIDIVVVWTLGEYYKTSLEVGSLLSKGAGAERNAFAATHRARTAAGNTFDVICLSDLVRFFQDRNRVEAEHLSAFGA